MRTLKPIIAFAILFVIVGISTVAGAQPADVAFNAVEVKTKGLSDNFGIIALAAGLCIGLAAFGGGIGQGRVAGTAVDGIARNPGASGDIRSQMILGLALIESLVIYALIISLLLVLKIG